MALDICVDPEALRALAQGLQNASNEMANHASHVAAVLAQMEFESRQRLGVESQCQIARNRSQDLTDRMQTMSKFLEAKAQAFEEADRECAGELSRIPGLPTGPNTSPEPSPEPAAALWQNLRGANLFQPEAWDRLVETQKLQLLKTVSDAMLGSHNVESDHLVRKQAFLFKSGHLGAEDGAFVIAVDDQLLSDPRSALETLIHETRHLIQMAAIQHPGQVPGVTSDMTEQWRQAHEDYPEWWNLPAYFGNPLETDARSYTADAIKQMLD